MTKNTLVLTLFLFLMACNNTCLKREKIDVKIYHLTIEPDFKRNSIKGSVVIDFSVKSNIDSVVFKSGNLIIDSVIGDHVTTHKKQGNDLIIYLSKRNCWKNQLVIKYHGQPKNGLIFDNVNDQAYTIYFTSKWMICNESPEDKAQFYLDITIPKNKTCVASGELINKVQLNKKTKYSYQLKTACPSYTYGFAIGKFNEEIENYNNLLLKYYSLNYTKAQLKEIFKETSSMISFLKKNLELCIFNLLILSYSLVNIFKKCQVFRC